MRRLSAVSLLALLALVPAADAIEPRTERSIYHSRHLWSTVNVCDTARNPDTIGVRGSMPGSGRRGETMWMRFQVQYLSSVDGLWHNFTRDGTDSGFVRIGRHARYRARQAGYLFPFSPAQGDRYVLRGVVTFEWRRKGRTVRRAKKRTTAPHRATVADPDGFSAARCEITG